MYYHGRASATGTAVTGVNTLWKGHSDYVENRVTEGQKFVWLHDDTVIYELDADPASDTSITLTGASITIDADTPMHYLIDDNATIKKNLYYVKHEAAFDWTWTIYLNDPAQTILRYTDRPSNAAAGWEYPASSGEFYLPRGITYNSVTRDVSGETPSVEVVIENLNNDLYDQFIVNAFRRAIVVIHGIAKWDDADFNDVVFKGMVNKVRANDDELSLLLTDVDDALKIQLRTCGQDCQFGFWFDDRCGVARPAASQNGVDHAIYDVDEVNTTAGVIHVDNATLNNSTTDVAATDYWDFSEVELKNSGGTLIRRLHGVDWTKTAGPPDDVGTLTIRSPLRTDEMPTASWTIELRRDCARTINHCTNRHDNRIRFGGFPTITDAVKNLGGFFK